MDLEVISNSIMDLSNSNLCAQILSSNLSQSYSMYVGLEKNRAWFRVRLVYVFKNWKLLFENICENTCEWKSV